MVEGDCGHDMLCPFSVESTTIFPAQIRPWLPPVWGVFEIRLTLTILSISKQKQLK